MACPNRVSKRVTGLYLQSFSTRCVYYRTTTKQLPWFLGRMRMLVRQRSYRLADVASVSNRAFVHVDKTMECKWHKSTSNPTSISMSPKGTRNHGTLMNRKLSQPASTMSTVAYYRGTLRFHSKFASPKVSMAEIFETVGSLVRNSQEKFGRRSKSQGCSGCTHN